MATLNVEFKQAWVTNQAGTLVEVTGNLQSADVTISNADADVTSFRAGGGPVAGNHIHGALQCTVKVVFFYDTTFARLCRQIAGARGGFLFRGYAGANAQPASGDEVFIASLIMPDYTQSYKPGARSTITASLDPVEFGATAPQFVTL